MGKRNLEDWINSGINGEYYKIIPDLEARIRAVYENSNPLVLGSGNGALNNGEYYYNHATKRLYSKASDGGDVNTKIIYLATYYQAWGTWATQAELNNNELFQTFEAQTDFYVRYIKIFVMKKGNPIFTNMKLEIHPELENYPTLKVLATSMNVWTNATINSYQNAASEIWFKFNDFAIKNQTKYVMVLKAQGTFDKDSHVSWIKIDPVYDDLLPNTMAQVSKGSHRFVIIGRQPWHIQIKSCLHTQRKIL